MDAWSGYLSYPFGWPHCGCGAVKLLCESLVVILFSQFRNVFPLLTMIYVKPLIRLQF